VFDIVLYLTVIATKQRSQQICWVQIVVLLA